MIIAAMIFLSISIIFWFFTITIHKDDKEIRTFTNGTVIDFTGSGDTSNLLVRFLVDGEYVSCESGIVDKEDFQIGDTVRISYDRNRLGSRVRSNIVPDRISGMVRLEEQKYIEERKRTDRIMKKVILIVAIVATMITALFIALAMIA